jgi:NAD(P)-dependent dehydrogenase (short-subunit alcohol dehydrogenase family)
VVVTGAASGIGRATSEAFARRGATVICADIDDEGARRVAAHLDDLGGHGHAQRLDVGGCDSWEAFAAMVAAEHGPPDVLVNNAGIGMGGPFLDHSAEDWRRITDVNLLGVVHGCRLFGAQMVAAQAEGGHRRRHIVNVASASGFTPNRHMAAYAATKAAVIMLSECLRADLSSDGIGVSVICPGFIATDIYQHSRFVGLDPADAADLVRRVTGLSERWMPGPGLVADRILDAVDRDRPMVPVTVGAWISYVVAHLSPPAMRIAARVDEVGALRALDRLMPVLHVADRAFRVHAPR